MLNLSNARIAGILLENPYIPDSIEKEHFAILSVRFSHPLTLHEFKKLVTNMPIIEPPHQESTNGDHFT